MAKPSKISGVNLTDFLGQLLVVSLPCGQLVQTTPELIPDPLARRYCKIISHHSRAGDLGSGYKLISVNRFADVSLNIWRRLKCPDWE
jgi:hypothetical protein